jgi:hypothetical protein
MVLINVAFVVGIEVVEMEDFVLEEEVELAEEESTEVLVNEVVEGVLGGVVSKVFGEERAVAVLGGWERRGQGFVPVADGI